MHEGKYSSEAIVNAQAALVSDFSSEGHPWVEGFESKFKRYVGARHAIAVSSGTAGLHSALLGLGIGPGDEVIVPAIAVIMDSNAIDYVGATPVFADVELDSWNLDPKSVSALISEKTKAVIAIAWFGLSPNLTDLKEICVESGLWLVEDSAEAIFSEEDRPRDWGLADVRMYSFESKKHLPIGGEGGMVTTDDSNLAEKIRKAAGIGYKHLSADAGRTSLAAREFQNPKYLRFDSIGYNYRLPPLNCAVGIGQLESIDKFLALRKECAAVLEDFVGSLPRFEPQKFESRSSHAYYSYGVRLLPHSSGKEWGWQDFYDEATRLGADGFYSNCMLPYLEPANKGRETGRQEFTEGLCPVAEMVQSSILAFKTNYLDMAEAERNARLYRDAYYNLES